MYYIIYLPKKFAKVANSSTLKEGYRASLNFKLRAKPTIQWLHNQSTLIKNCNKT